MTQDDRWRRMSRLVDIDLDAMAAQLKVFEGELNDAKAQFEYLADFRHQSEEILSKPTEYGSVQDIQRQIIFIESLRSAMTQQETLISNRHQHLEQVRQQVLELYQKKESYLLLAKEAELQKAQKEDHIEDQFLDELAQRRNDSSDDSLTL